VTRQADPTHTRVSLVTLTENGQRLFDEVAPVHLANEDRVLTALSPEERSNAPTCSDGCWSTSKPRPAPPPQNSV
jgi:DNA-binding MarR family transcriptional regulator